MSPSAWIGRRARDSTPEIVLVSRYSSVSPLPERAASIVCDRAEVLGGQMPADVKLSVEHVSKSFLVNRQTGERVHALDDCSLTVDTGEVIALIGSSGCGKTTLLKIIHGLIGADDGVIRLDGRTVQGPGYDRGMVFQDSRLLPWRTATENV